MIPPWAIASLGASVLICVHYLLLRAASGRIGDSLGALVLEASAAIGIAVFYFAQRIGTFGKMSSEAADVTTTTRAGIGFAVASGLAVSGASVLLFYALRKGGPVASTGTIVLGGGVVLSALFAPLLFGESFSVRRAVGVGLGVVAMIVLVSSPAASPP